MSSTIFKNQLQNIDVVVVPTFYLENGAADRPVTIRIKSESFLNPSKSESVRKSLGDCPRRRAIATLWSISSLSL